MRVRRRELALAGGVLALGGAALLRGPAALADPADEAAVKAAVEALRKAVLSQEKAALESLAADQLTYGHLSGKVQNKAEFIAGVMNRKAVVRSLTFSDMWVGLAGDAANVRHGYQSQAEANGKLTEVKLSVLSVWVREDSDWKLLARQGYKPTTGSA